MVITKISTLGYHIRSQTIERSVSKEVVVLRRMANPGETLKLGIKRVDKGQISCQHKMQTADCRLGLKCRLRPKRVFSI